MRKCVTIDVNGDAVGAFDTLKEAADYYKLQPSRVFKAIRMNKVVLNMKFMYEEDYMAIIEKGKKKTLVWGDTQKKKRRRKTKEEKEKISSTLMKNSEYNKNIFSRSFIDFAKHHIVWMKQLKDSFLKTGDFGIRPELFADYYSDIKDKEVVLLASMLITMSGNCYGRIQQYRNIIGEHPWEWFKNRGFSCIKNIWPKERARLFGLMDAWWQECFKDGFGKSIGESLFFGCEKYGISPLEMMERTCVLRGWKISRLRMAIILLFCSNSHGIGTGLWNISEDKIIIPITGPLVGFLQTWMPNFKKYGSPDECIPLFDMDSVDFYYCYLAYEKLKYAHPQECSKYASYYFEVYHNRSYIEPKIWRKKLPKIDFALPNEDNY